MPSDRLCLDGVRRRGGLPVTAIYSFSCCVVRMKAHELSFGGILVGGCLKQADDDCDTQDPMLFSGELGLLGVMEGRGKG